MEEGLVVARGAVHDAVTPDARIHTGAQLGALELAILCGWDNKCSKSLKQQLILLRLLLTCYAERGPGHQFHPIEAVFTIAGAQELHADGTRAIHQREIGSLIPAGAEDLHEFVGIRVGTQRTGHNGET